jgi:integrase/recombinase XerD
MSTRSSAEDVLRLFLDYLSVEKGLAANTIVSYGRDLRKFFLFLQKEKTDWARADENTLRLFVHRLSQAGIQARSLARLISALRSFYKFLVLDGLASKDPTSDLTSPKTWLSLPKFLTVDEAARLVLQPDERDLHGLRDRAMLEVLYATGLRVSELIRLRPADVNLDDGYVICMEKGARRRSFLWGGRRLPDGSRGGRPRFEASGAVFLTRLSDPSPIRAFGRCYGTMRKAGLGARINPSSAFVRHPSLERADLRSVQLMLGLARSTTQIYTRQPGVFAGLRKFHPRLKVDLFGREKRG